LKDTVGSGEKRGGRALLSVFGKSKIRGLILFGQDRGGWGPTNKGTAKGERVWYYEGHTHSKGE